MLTTWAALGVHGDASIPALSGLRNRKNIVIAGYCLRKMIADPIHHVKPPGSGSANFLFILAFEGSFD
jgi:hypothetical protein